MDEARFATALVVARDNMELRESFPESAEVGRVPLPLQRPSHAVAGAGDVLSPRRGVWSRVMGDDLRRYLSGDLSIISPRADPVK
jgi:hypothetical protein